MVYDRQDHIDHLYETHSLNKQIEGNDWAIFILNEASQSFIHQADLPTLLTAVTAIEATLRKSLNKTDLASLKTMIDESSLNFELKDRLHMLRKYRNQWVHQKQLAEKADITTDIYQIEVELEDMAYFALKCGYECVYWQE